jgi:hypothetical protein
MAEATMRRVRDCEGFYRRDFLTAGAAGLLGLSLADVLRREARGARKAAGARGVILVWLGGGPATIDMWDLKPAAPENVRGDFRPVATKAPGVQICEHLPRVAALMDCCALVRSLHHSIPEHGPAAVHMATGHPPAAAMEYPSLGSLAAKVLPPSPGVPSYVALAGQGGAGFPGGAGYLGPAYGPFSVSASAERGRMEAEGTSLPAGFTLTQLQDRTRLRSAFDARFRTLDKTEVPASLDRFQQQALDILRSDRTRKAFDLDAEKPALREAYGRGPFGDSLLAARRLIEAGTRFATVGLGGWDTHANTFNTLRNQLLPPLDRGLAALVTDLHDRGLLGETLVYCAGEFGRTPRINAQSGRDHWSRSMAVFLAGGGVRGGYVHGSTDARGEAPSGEPCSPTDVSATVFGLLGIEPTHEIHTPSGRPMALFREGKVIEGLV